MCLFTTSASHIDSLWTHPGHAWQITGSSRLISQESPSIGLTTFRNNICTGDKPCLHTRVVEGRRALIKMSDCSHQYAAQLKYLLYMWRKFPPPLASMVPAVRSSFPFKKWLVVVIAVAQLNRLIRVGCHKCWEPCLQQIRLLELKICKIVACCWISWLLSILKVKRVKVVWNNAKSKSSTSVCC